MSDSPYEGMPAGPTPWIPRCPIPSKGSSGLSTIAAIALSLLAVASAAAGCSKPAPETKTTEPQYSEQQVADAKKNLCDAYDTMLRAIKSAGSLNSEDPDQKFMLALNTRIAFNASADYLLSEANLNPAAPSDLLGDVRRLADSYQRMVLAQIAQASKDELDSIYGELDDHESAIVKACK